MVGGGVNSAVKREEHWLLLRRTQVRVFAARSWWLTSSCTPGECNASLWPLGALHGHAARKTPRRIKENNCCCCFFNYDLKKSWRKTWKITQLIKHLPHKHGDPNSDPKNPCKMMIVACNPSRDKVRNKSLEHTGQLTTRSAWWRSRTVREQIVNKRQKAPKA